MAIVQNTLIGRARNKVGGTTFSTWKGKNVLKSKPLTVTNPQSDAQKAQRSAMRQLVAFGRPFLSVIRQSWIEASIGSTEWASWIKYNVKTAFTFAPPDANIRNGEFAFARGTLVNPSDLYTFSSILQVNTINWTNNAGVPGANNSDTFCFAAQDTTGHFYMVNTGVTRATETAEVTVPDDVANQAAYFYGWFVNTSTRKASDSIAIGSTD